MATVTTSATAQATLKKADLVVTSVSAPARATVGTRVTLRAKVRNQGTLKARGSVLSFRLSKDQAVGRDVALKPTKATPPLRPRKTWSGSASVTIPASVVPGRYYVLACADATRRVREKREGNNCRPTAAVQVTEPASSHELIDADLEAGLLTAEQALTYKVFSDFRDPRLPSKYVGNPDAVDEGALSEAADSWPDLSAQTQEVLRPFLIPPFYAGSHWSPGSPGRPAGDAALVSSSPWCSGSDGGSPLFETWSYLDVPGGQYRIWWLTKNPGDATQAAHLSSVIATTILPQLTALMGRGPQSDEGLCDGGSGATDIALVDAQTATVYGDGFLCGDGVSSHMVWPRTKPAAWAGIDPYLAHEVMHTIQFGFPQDGWCSDYEWLREMTAQWVMDYVTDPEYGIGLVPDDTEFEAVPHFMDHTNTSLDADTPKKHGYGAYLFAQWAARQLSPTFIRDIWDNVAGMDATHAVNTALQGSGFADTWAAFALSNWNRGPIDDYQQWDNMTMGAKLAGTESIPPNTPSKPIVKVNHLAALYVGLAIDPKVDELEVLNDKAGDTHAKLQAVVTYGDGTHKVFDLNQPKNYLCINNGTKKVTHVVLIFSNSHMEDETTFNPTITGKTNCGCANSTPRPAGGVAPADAVCEGGNVTFSWTHENIKLNDDGTERWHIDESGSGSLILNLMADPDDPETYVNAPSSTYTVSSTEHAEFYTACAEVGDTTHEGSGNLGEFATFTTFDPDSDELWISNAIQMEATKHTVTTTCGGTTENTTTDHLITPECPPTPEGGNYFWEFEPVAPGSDTYTYSCTGQVEYDDGLGHHLWTKTVQGTVTLPD